MSIKSRPDWFNCSRPPTQSSHDARSCPAVKRRVIRLAAHSNPDTGVAMGDKRHSVAVPPSSQARGVRRLREGGGQPRSWSENLVKGRRESGKVNFQTLKTKAVSEEHN